MISSPSRSGNDLAAALTAAVALAKEHERLRRRHADVPRERFPDAVELVG
jgi:hypothetical protein